MFGEATRVVKADQARFTRLSAQTAAITAAAAASIRRDETRSRGCIGRQIGDEIVTQLENVKREEIKNIQGTGMRCH